MSTHNRYSAPPRGGSPGRPAPARYINPQAQYAQRFGTNKRDADGYSMGEFDSHGRRMGTGADGRDTAYQPTDFQKELSPDGGSPDLRRLSSGGVPKVNVIKGAGPANAGAASGSDAQRTAPSAGSAAPASAATLFPQTKVAAERVRNAAVAAATSYAKSPKNWSSTWSSARSAAKPPSPQDPGWKTPAYNALHAASTRAPNPSAPGRTWSDNGETEVREPAHQETILTGPNRDIPMSVNAPAGRAIEYDPTHDKTMQNLQPGDARLPKEGDPSLKGGVVTRGVVIDPRYVAKGASNIGYATAFPPAKPAATPGTNSGGDQSQAATPAPASTPSQSQSQSQSGFPSANAAAAIVHAGINAATPQIGASAAMANAAKTAAGTVAVKRAPMWGDQPGFGDLHKDDDAKIPEVEAENARRALQQSQQSRSSDSGGYFF